MNTVYPAMQVLNLESESLTKINHQVEQIFYCLYGQQKKTKVGIFVGLLNKAYIFQGYYFKNVYFYFLIKKKKHNNDHLNFRDGI